MTAFAIARQIKNVCVGKCLDRACLGLYAPHNNSEHAEAFMAEDRLALIAPELSEKLKRAESTKLRKALLAVCRFSLDRAKLAHPVIDNLLLSLENGKP